MTDAPRLDHGATGNGRVLALVSPTTRIDWLCMPRFDSPSLFASLLDPDRGGTFAFEPVGGDMTCRMEYIPNTNVLRTVVASSTGSFEILDYAPRIPHGLGVHAPPELHRVVLLREGNPLVRVRFDPRPDYGRVVPRIAQTAQGLEVVGGASPCYLNTNVPTLYIQGGQPFRLDRARYFVLSWGRPSDVDGIAQRAAAGGQEDEQRRGAGHARQSTGFHRACYRSGVPAPRRRTATDPASNAPKASRAPSGQVTVTSSTRAASPRPTCTRGSFEDW